MPNTGWLKLLISTQLSHLSASGWSRQEALCTSSLVIPDGRLRVFHARPWHRAGLDRAVVSFKYVPPKNCCHENPEISNISVSQFSNLRLPMVSAIASCIKPIAAHVPHSHAGSATDVQCDCAADPKKHAELESDTMEAGVSSVSRVDVCDESN